MVLRGQYPSGHIVEEFDDEDEARSAVERHRRHGVRVAVGGPSFPGELVPARGVLPTGCSFCGKDRRAVADLINGPGGAGGAICNECVALCNEIIGGGAAG